MNSSQVRSAVRLLLMMSMAAAASHAPPASAQDDAPAEAGQSDAAGSADAAGADAENADGQAQGEVQEITITARQKTAAGDVIRERLEQPVVVDLVGSEQISRVGDSTVSLALRRLPGVTLVNDQFIYIRGLGERYSSTTLNGAYVPSPDLTRNVIPLDIFPAQIVESLSIQKGYTPDRPAAFGGGNVDVRTRSIPESFLMQFQVGSGWNTDSSEDALTYAGGRDDKWGTDDGTRALSGAIRDAVQTFRGRLSPVAIFDGLRRAGEPVTLADAEAINRELATSLNRSVDLREKSLSPDYSVEAAIGNSWRLDEAENWKLGFLALGDYGNQWRNRTRLNRSVLAPDLDRGETRRSINQVSLTASLNLGLEFTRDHALGVTGIYLRNTEDEAALVQRNNFNFRRDQGQQLRDYLIRFEERDLQLLQVNGRHTFGADTASLVGSWLDPGPLIENLSFSWYFSDATARTNIPNEVTISAVDRIDPDTAEVLQSSIRSTSSAADFRFTSLRDEVRSYGWKLAKPFALGSFVAELSGGWDYYEKGRSYLQTQLGLGTTSLAAAPVLVGTPGQVFTAENILDPANGFLLSLGGIGTESYLAGEAIDAAFGAFDVTWNDAWRLSGGVRREDYSLLSVPVDPLQFDTRVGKIPLTAEQLRNSARSGDDLYPALALTHMRRGFWAEDFQLRFGWSRTNARADLREVAASFYIDPFTDARVRGNPALVPSDLTNYDIRAEWFFANRDNLTLSLFYKDIDRPIETIEGAGTDNNLSFTFVNAEKAELYGVEVEWLKDLGFLGERLGNWASGFFVAGNFTWSDSRITIGDVALNLTNNERRLTQQADWITNVQLGYDSPGGKHSATVVYNGYSDRLFFGGRNGAPDAFEEQFNSLDLVYGFYPSDSLSFKLRVQNILDDDVSIRQGGVRVLEQELGTSFKLDATLRF